MNNQRSEHRIRNNKLRRRRQLRKNIALCFMTVLLIAGLSTVFFSFKTKAQTNAEPAYYKYYKSISVGAGDTLWDYAKTYANEAYYDSYNSYIKEVMTINHLKNDKIVYGQHIIIPYYDE